MSLACPLFATTGRRLFNQEILAMTHEETKVLLFTGTADELERKITELRLEDWRLFSLQWLDALGEQDKWAAVFKRT